MDGLEGFLPSSGLVLELGCGDGKLLRELVRRGIDVVGLDRSHHALNLAGSAGTSLVRGDARRLPVRQATFALVIARYLLGALRADDRSHAARAAWDAVAPGGTLWVEEFMVDDFRARQGTAVEPGTVDRNRGIITHYWTSQEIHSLVDLEPVWSSTRSWPQRTRDGLKTRSAVQAAWTKPSP